MAKAPKTTTAPTGQIAPFGLRMLPELKEKIEVAARESGRSMNAEIVSRLEESLRRSSMQSAQEQFAQAVEDLGPPNRRAPSADDIADKVAEKLAKRMVVHPISEEMSRFIQELYLDSNQKHSDEFKERLGFDPKTPRVQQHGGPPVKSTNAKRSIKKT